MTTTETRDLTAELSAKADRHLWGHFARHGHGISAPIISRGEGCYIYDTDGRRFIDTFASLLTTICGHHRPEVHEAMIDAMIRLEKALRPHIDKLKL